MSERLALDRNAAVDYFRVSRAEPPHLSAAEEIFRPLPVLGELYMGAFGSDRVEESVSTIEQAILAWKQLLPDQETARLYGKIGADQKLPDSASPRTERAHRNDLWIAALCLQHKIPLLTKDQRFDSIAGLEVIHW